MEFDDLKRTWEESKKSESNKTEITMEQLTEIINTRKDFVTSKMKNGIRLSLGMNLILAAGAINILVSYGGDMISLIVGLACLIILIMFSIFSVGQYRNFMSLDDGLQSVREKLMRRINFFKVGYRWIVVAIALAGAFVYILGSTTYLNIKYGQISLDGTDIMVHLIAIFIALSIGLIANTREHNQYLAELEVCLADLENREISSESFMEGEKKRRRKYIMIAVLGLVLLALLILYLFF